MTTENIYICTGRKSRHNNHTVMYYFLLLFIH